MGKTVVVNLTHEAYDVYIGRPSQWGNPYIVNLDGTREEVITKFRQHLLSSPELLSYLPTLVGKRLGCFCKPESCHGDVLVELLASLDES